MPHDTEACSTCNPTPKPTLRVTSPVGRVYRYAAANWSAVSSGALNIISHDGRVIAVFASGQWASVEEETS